MNFIDLFSGAGGLSEGFINAGFNPIAHVEMDRSACQTLETRLIYHKLKHENQLDQYYKYLRGDVSRFEFLEDFKDKELLKSVINLPIGEETNGEIFDTIDSLKGKKKVDLIIGGPPCQAYSLVGRARDSKGMKNDPRNLLYKEYAKFLTRYEPKVFVFENVTGLLSANNGGFFNDIQEYFKSIGYELECRVQKSEDFGVLQKRRRLILLGWKEGVSFKYPDFKKIEHSFSIKDLLSDLKPLKPGELINVTKYSTETNEYLERFNLRNGVDFVTQHIARPHNERDLEIYRIAIKKLNKGERLRYPDLPENLKTHNNQKSFLDRFKVVDPHGYCHTMVAHIAKDGHHYIYPSLKQIRSLSVREAARIQSFPDDFYFEGGRTAAFKQIGNAVPPLMAREIAVAIKKLL